MLAPLGVALEGEPPQHRTTMYQIPGVLSLVLIPRPHHSSTVVCWLQRRRTALSCEQLYQLESLLKHVRRSLPPWIPKELSMEEEANRDLDNEPLRLELAWQQREGKTVAVVWLIAATPRVSLTRDLLESLLIAVRCRLNWLAREEAICFYAVDDPCTKGSHHLMVPDRRSVCRPALCGTYAPTSDAPWSGHWFLLPVPGRKDPQDDAEQRGLHLCPACLAAWKERTHR